MLQSNVSRTLQPPKGFVHLRYRRHVIILATLLCLHAAASETTERSPAWSPLEAVYVVGAANEVKEYLPSIMGNSYLIAKCVIRLFVVEHGQQRDALHQVFQSIQHHHLL